MIRDYVYFNKPADDNLVKMIAKSNGIEFGKLKKFIGVPVQEFYSKIVCGGILMELRKDSGPTQKIEAPLAFQSAMAGILELAEIVISKAGLRKDAFPSVTQFHPLQPVKHHQNPNNYDFSKDTSGRCICADQDFVAGYDEKWLKHST